MLFLVANESEKTMQLLEKSEVELLTSSTRKNKFTDLCDAVIKMLNSEAVSSLEKGQVLRVTINELIQVDSIHYYSSANKSTTLKALEKVLSDASIDGRLHAGFYDSVASIKTSKKRENPHYIYDLIIEL